MKNSDSISHRTVFQNNSKIERKLELSEKFGIRHVGGTYPLLCDMGPPDTFIIGQCVLRSLDDSSDLKRKCITQIHGSEVGFRSSISEESREMTQLQELIYSTSRWIYNIDGQDGGGGISRGNIMDAQRLCLQYGLSDAVLVSSKIVAMEGEDYLWLPSTPSSWSHILTKDPTLLEDVNYERNSLQDKGVLSTQRREPAVIIMTESGQPGGYDSGSAGIERDFLRAKIFQQKNKNGMLTREVYILTTNYGAKNIEKRAHKYELQNQIQNIIIRSSLEPENPMCRQINVENIINFLQDLGMKLVTLDGGLYWWDRFIKAGLLSQMNLTLMFSSSFKEILGQNYDTTNKNYHQLFSKSDGQIPREMEIASILIDDVKEAIFTVMDTKKLKGIGIQ